MGISGNGRYHWLWIQLLQNDQVFSDLNFGNLLKRHARSSERTRYALILEGPNGQPRRRMQTYRMSWFVIEHGHSWRILTARKLDGRLINMYTRDLPNWKTQTQDFTAKELPCQCRQPQGSAAQNGYTGVYRCIYSGCRSWFKFNLITLLPPMGQIQSEDDRACASRSRSGWR